MINTAQYNLVQVGNTNAFSKHLESSATEIRLAQEQLELKDSFGRSEEQHDTFFSIIAITTECGGSYKLGAEMIEKLFELNSIFRRQELDS